MYGRLRLSSDVSEILPCQGRRLTPPSPQRSFQSGSKELAGLAKNTDTYGSAARHFDLACQYKNAADLLHVQFRSGTNQLSVREPIYYLYYHAVELILKSFLHARNRSFRNTHDVNVLYNMCCDGGMKVKDDHHFAVKNCIDLLRAGNRNHFYRA
jgi:hypothetical protein